jgi:drug/metabolite transporter (DMT)-like permease
MLRNSSAAFLSFAGLLTFGFSWGLTQPLTKISVSTGYQPIGIIFWQFVFGLLLIGLVLAFLRIPVPREPQHLRYYLAIALIGTLIPNSFSFLAAAQLPAGIMSLAIATVPMFSLGLALALGNERFRIRRLAGIFLGVTAMMLIVLPEASLPDPGQAWWVLVALAAPLCYGFEGNFVAMKAPRDAHPMAVLWGASVIGTVISLPWAILSGNWIDMFAPWAAPEWAIFGTSAAHAIAYSGYMWLVGFAGVVFSAQIAYIVTLSGITIAIIFLGESYSIWVWGAVGLMLLALSMVQPAARMPDTESV